MTLTLSKKRDSANKLGISSLQKIIATLRMLAYGLSGDFMDKYVWIGETTALQSLKKKKKLLLWLMLSLRNT